MMIFTCIVALAIHLFRPNAAELYTSTADLQRLIQIEDQLVKLMEKYVENQEIKLDKIKSMIKDFESFHQKATTDDFLHNPINSFLLIKKLTREWKIIQAVMNDDTGKGFLANYAPLFHDENLGLIERFKDEPNLPNEEDLRGAAIGLMRLQNTYLLNASMLSQGIVKQKYTDRKLTSEDCFDIGRELFDAGEYYLSIQWMELAKKQWLQEKDRNLELFVIVLEHLASASYIVGKVESALLATMEILKVNPNNTIAKLNMLCYQHELKGMKPKALERENETSSKFSEHFNVLEQQISSLCRGELEQSDINKSKLKCRHVNRKDSFLRLAPLREEEINLRPRIVVYRNFLSDREINVIKQLAEFRLNRATVVNPVTSASEVASYRISKSAWLPDEEDPIIAGISRRIESVTGLDMTASEDLQVANYGIGGYYLTHCDYSRNDEAIVSAPYGNRIATWLNYMSDVEAGGATVFPHLQVGIWPEKGSAAFWYNLHRNGQGNELTCHAACPVLFGSKWVSTKWIHERDQEFRHPCSIDPHE